MDRLSFFINFFVELFLNKTSMDGSIARHMLKPWHLLDISRSIELYEVSISALFAISSHFSRSLSRQKRLLTFQTLTSLLKLSNPRDFRHFLSSNHLVWYLFFSLFMHFMHLDLSFGVFEIVLVFFKIFEFLLKFWDGSLFKWSLNFINCITWAL